MKCAFELIADLLLFFEASDENCTSLVRSLGYSLHNEPYRMGEGTEDVAWSQQLMRDQVDRSA
jgi:hypothetical protein